jgi:hypothetical protein
MGWKYDDKKLEASNSGRSTTSFRSAIETSMPKVRMNHFRSKYSDKTIKALTFDLDATTNLLGEEKMPGTYLQSNRISVRITHHGLLSNLHHHHYFALDIYLSTFGSLTA